MYQYLNVHPKGLRVGDCVKRAITKATGLEYMEVQKELNRFKKITGAEKFNSDRNCDKYVEQVLKGKRLSFPVEAGKPRMNGERFSNEFKKGYFILRMAGHWTACVNGVIYDTWDCTDKCVYNAWEIIPENIISVEQYLKEEQQAKKEKEQAKAREKVAKDKLKEKEKLIKDKYKQKMKPYLKKIKELEKQMEQELNKVRGIA